MKAKFLAGIFVLLIALTNCSKKQEAPVIKRISYADSVAGKFQVTIISGYTSPGVSQFDTSHSVLEITALDTTHIMYNNDTFELFNHDSARVSFQGRVPTCFNGAINRLSFFQHFIDFEGTKGCIYLSGSNTIRSYGTRIQ